MYLWIIMACGKDGTVETPLQGRIATDPGPTGDFHASVAYARVDGNSLVAYVSSRSEASCDDAATYVLDGKKNDPSKVFDDGACNLYVSISDWSGSLEAQDDAMVVAGSSIECAMGVGAWSEVTDPVDGSTWEWSGDLWVGTPRGYTWSLSTDGNDVLLDLQMDDYNGSFPYGGTVEEADASGAVDGVVRAKPCDALGG